MVRTAKPLNLRAGDWATNGLGRNVSHSFGYGLMDAGEMVKRAANWTRIPEQHKCSVAYPSNYKSVLELVFFSAVCVAVINGFVFAILKSS